MRCFCANVQVVAYVGISSGAPLPNAVVTVDIVQVVNASLKVKVQSFLLSVSGDEPTPSAVWLAPKLDDATTSVQSDNNGFARFDNMNFHNMFVTSGFVLGLLTPSRTPRITAAYASFPFPSS